MNINYTTCTLEELIAFIDTIIKETATKLHDSPLSRAESIHNTIGFAQGVCAARGLDFPYATYCDWRELAINGIKINQFSH